MLNFKQIRKKRNFTQSEFAEIIGVSTRALSNYENGNTDISLKKMQEIAHLLNLTVVDLIDINSKDIDTFLPERQNKETPNKELLEEQIELLQQNSIVKDDIILMQKIKIALLEDSLEPYKKLIKNISERVSSLENFDDALRLKYQVEQQIEKVEKEINSEKKSINGK